MAKSKSGKVKSRAIAAPQSRTQAEQYMAEIGELARQIAAIERSAEGQIDFHVKTIELLKLDARGKVGVLEQSLQELAKGLQAWSEAHRDELLDGQGKSFTLVSGVCSWALTPPSVKVKSGSSMEDAIIELQRLRQKKYLRVRTELDKEAILADRGAFTRRGFETLEVTQQEEFILKPNDIPVELRTRKGAKLKRVVIVTDE